MSYSTKLRKRKQVLSSRRFYVFSKEVIIKMVNKKDAANSKSKAANKNKGKKKGGKGLKQSNIPRAMTINSKKNQRSPTGGSPSGNLKKCACTDDRMEIDASKVLDFGSLSR